MKHLNIRMSTKQFMIALGLFLVTTLLLQNRGYSQQQIGYYPNMDGGYENQTGGNLAATLDTNRWTYVSSGNGQERIITTSGGYGGPKYVTVGKTSAATSNSSTTINSNEVKTTTFMANTLYVVQFYYRANSASVGIPSTGSYVFISADGASGNRKTTTVTLSTPTSWTLFTDTVRTNSTATQTNTGTAGINIKTPTIGTATMVDIDNFVVYPADNQTTGAPDVTAPDAATNQTATAPSPADILVSWTAPVTGTDSGGYIVVRYTSNPGSTDNPLQNAIYGIGDSVNNTNQGIVVYIGKGTSFDDVYNVAGNTTYYYKIYTVDKAFNYSSAVIAQATTASFTFYYYNGIGSIENVSSWGTNPNGSGTPPVNFTTPGQYFYLQNTTNATLANPWVVSGSSSKIILGNTTQPAITLTVASTASLTGDMDVVTPSTGSTSININGGTIPTFGVVTGNPNLTIGTNINTTIPKKMYGNVIINTPSNVLVNMGDTLLVNNFTVNTGSVFSTTTNAATNNTLSPVTIASGGLVTINGTFETGKTGGFVSTSVAAALNFLSGTPNYVLGTNSTIVYTKVSTTTAQTISAIQYANLTIAGASPKQFETANVLVSGNLVYTNTGGTTGNLLVAPTSIEFNGKGLQYFDSLPSPYYSDVTFSGGGTKRLHTSAIINGVISLVNGKVDVADDTLIITALATLGTGNISATDTSYIETGNSATGRVLLQGVGAASTLVVPVGSPKNYLPVTLTPAQNYVMAIAAYDGLTNDGTFSGTPVSPAIKAQSVNAFWNISDISGTGNVQVSVNWPQSIEGSTFTTLPNNQIALVEYNGTNWLPGSYGTADNTNNVATDSFSTFTVFTVTKKQGLLPVTDIKLNLIRQNNSILVNWNTINEINTAKCVVERSNDGINFSDIYTTNAAGTISAKSYTYTDKFFTLGLNYYRIKLMDIEGNYVYSPVQYLGVQEKPTFVVLSNPIINNNISIQANAIEDGNYKVMLLNSIGQKLITKEFSISGNAIIMNLSVSATLGAGIYYVEIVGKGLNNTIPVIIK